MKIVYNTKETYLSGGGRVRFGNTYDYVLFRQDMNGSEHVYFNRRDIKRVMAKVHSGDIPVHANYSVLYCRTLRLLRSPTVREISSMCYATCKARSTGLKL